MLPSTQNPLIHRGGQVAVNITDLPPSVLVRRRRDREIRDTRRRKTAAEAIAGLTRSPANEIYGVTRGQFSLIDLISACGDLTGPARFVLATWKASRPDVERLWQMADASQLLSVRILADFTLLRFAPDVVHFVCERFGTDALRLGRNHSKFALFENDCWRLVVRTSMNLNENRRMESFTVSHDPQLADFLITILDEVWAKHPHKLIDAREKTIKRFFADEM